MKASEINPSSWYYGGLSKPRTTMLMRKWGNILKSAKLMEETLLELMNNTETTPEQAPTTPTTPPPPAEPVTTPAKPK